jgi:hypothetical protein
MTIPRQEDRFHALCPVCIPNSNPNFPKIMKISMLPFFIHRNIFIPKVEKPWFGVGCFQIPISNFGWNQNIDFDTKVLEALVAANEEPSIPFVAANAEQDKDTILEEVSAVVNEKLGW